MSFFPVPNMEETEWQLMNVERQVAAAASAASLMLLATFSGLGFGDFLIHNI
jgi:hypothetical protein